MGARHVGAGEESTYGTAVAPTIFPYVKSEGIQIERDMQEVPSLDVFSTTAIEEIKSIVRGPWEIWANYDGIGLLLDHLFGNHSTSGAGPYTHTFPDTIPAADRIGKSLTIEANRDNGNWRYAGMKISAFEHEFNVDGPSIMRFELVGQGETTPAAATPTSPTKLLMLPKHFTIKIDGGSALPVKSGSIRFENPIDEPHTLGQAGIVVEPDRDDTMKLICSADIIFQNMTDFYDSFDGSTEIDFQIVATNGTESLTYNVNEALIIQATPHMDGRERIVATVQVKAKRENAANELAEVILVNNEVTI